MMHTMSTKSDTKHTDKTNVTAAVVADVESLSVRRVKLEPGTLCAHLAVLLPESTAVINLVSDDEDGHKPVSAAVVVPMDDGAATPVVVQFSSPIAVVPTPVVVTSVPSPSPPEKTKANPVPVRRGSKKIKSADEQAKLDLRAARLKADVAVANAEHEAKQRKKAAAAKKTAAKKAAVAVESDGEDEADSDYCDVDDVAMSGSDGADSSDSDYDDVTDMELTTNYRNEPVLISSLKEAKRTTEETASYQRRLAEYAKNKNCNQARDETDFRFVDFEGTIIKHNEFRCKELDDAGLLVSVTYVDTIESILVRTDLFAKMKTARKFGCLFDFIVFMSHKGILQSVTKCEHPMTKLAKHERPGSKASALITDYLVGAYHPDALKSYSLNTVTVDMLDILDKHVTRDTINEEKFFKTAAIAAQAMASRPTSAAVIVPIELGEGMEDDATLLKDRFNVSDFKCDTSATKMSDVKHTETADEAMVAQSVVEINVARLEDPTEPDEKLFSRSKVEKQLSYDEIYARAEDFSVRALAPTSVTVKDLPAPMWFVPNSDPAVTPFAMFKRWLASRIADECSARNVFGEDDEGKMVPVAADKILFLKNEKTECDLTHYSTTAPSKCFLCLCLADVCDLHVRCQTETDADIRVFYYEKLCNAFKFLVDKTKLLKAAEAVREDLEFKAQLKKDKAEEAAKKKAAYAIQKKLDDEAAKAALESAKAEEEKAAKAAKAKAFMDLANRVLSASDLKLEVDNMRKGFLVCEAHGSFSVTNTFACKFCTAINRPTVLRCKHPERNKDANDCFVCNANLCAAMAAGTKQTGTVVKALFHTQFPDKSLTGSKLVAKKKTDKVAAGDKRKRVEESVVATAAAPAVVVAPTASSSAAAPVPSAAPTVTFSAAPTIVTIPKAKRIKRTQASVPVVPAAPVVSSESFLVEMMKQQAADRIASEQRFMAAQAASEQRAAAAQAASDQRFMAMMAALSNNNKKSE